MNESSGETPIKNLEERPPTGEHTESLRERLLTLPDRWASDFRESAKTLRHHAREIESGFDRFAILHAANLRDAMAGYFDFAGKFTNIIRNQLERKSPTKEGER